jgi:chromosome segregation ATPase
MADIFRRLQRISEQLTSLEAYVEKLEEERDSLHVRLEEKDGELEAMQKKYEAAKEVKKMGNGVDEEALRKKIDNYLEEIDICLKVFGNPS